MINPLLVSTVRKREKGKRGERRKETSVVLSSETKKKKKKRHSLNSAQGFKLFVSKLENRWRCLGLGSVIDAGECIVLTISMPERAKVSTHHTPT